MTLLELAERCEQATGPDRELDIAIHTKTSGFPPRNGGVGWPKGALVVPMFPGWKPLPAYTASLDAAMTLVPTDELGEWEMFLGESRWRDLTERWCVHFERIVDGHEVEGYAYTPQLALCAAALRARAASGTEAQRATTAQTGVVHDGPAPQGDAHNLPPYPSTD